MTSHRAGPRLFPKVDPQGIGECIGNRNGQNASEHGNARVGAGMEADHQSHGRHDAGRETETDAGLPGRFIGHRWDTR